MKVLPQPRLPAYMKAVAIGLANPSFEEPQEFIYVGQNHDKAFPFAAARVKAQGCKIARVKGGFVVWR